MGSLRGLVYFDPDWTAHFVALRINLFRGWGIAPGGAALVVALKPLLTQFGVEIVVPRVQVSRIIQLGVQSHRVMVRIKLKSFWLLLPTSADVLIRRQPSKHLESFGKVISSKELHKVLL